MDDQFNRRMLGAQAVGALKGLLAAGVLTNFPRNAELAKQICDGWDATEAAIEDSHVTTTLHALPRPGSEATEGA